MKYILEKPIKGTLGKEKHESSIQWRNGVLKTDEPKELGGQDKGPDPYTLLLSSLVTCTLATLRMYLEIKNITLFNIEVEANMFQKLEQDGLVMHIERSITFGDEYDEELHVKLLRIAENCPVSKLLKGNIKISTTFKN